MFYSKAPSESTQKINYHLNISYQVGLWRNWDEGVEVILCSDFAGNNPAASHHFILIENYFHQ